MSAWLVAHGLMATVILVAGLGLGTLVGFVLAMAIVQDRTTRYDAAAERRRTPVRPGTR